MLFSCYTKTGQTCMRDNWDTGGIVTRWTTWNISAISAADPVYGILAMKKKAGGTSVIHFLAFLFVARNQNEPKGHQVVKKVGDMWADGTQSSQISIRSSLFWFFKNWSGSSQVAFGKYSSLLKHSQLMPGDPVKWCVGGQDIFRSDQIWDFLFCCSLSSNVFP